MTMSAPQEAVGYTLGHELGELGQDPSLTEKVLDAIPDGWTKRDGQWMQVEHHSTRPNTGVYLFILRPPGGSSVGAPLDEVSG